MQDDSAEEGLLSLENFGHAWWTHDANASLGRCPSLALRDGNKAGFLEIEEVAMVSGIHGVQKKKIKYHLIRAR